MVEPYLQIETHDQDGATVLVVSGELDAASTAGLDEALDGIDRACPVRLDLSGVSFIDSSGLRTVTAAIRSRDGAGGLRITAISPSAERVFTMAGLSAFLPR